MPRRAAVSTPTHCSPFWVVAGRLASNAAAYLQTLDAGAVRPAAAHRAAAQHVRWSCSIGCA
eukprot:5587133-Alexandrium_andersonii.AAC.1